MTDTRIVIVNRVERGTIGREAFNKRAVCHSRIVKHVVCPHEFHQICSVLRMAGHVMRLELEATRERRYRLTGFNRWRAVRTHPSRLQSIADRLRSRAIGDASYDGP